jgi:excisionase family DNA binding protein
MGQPQFWGMTMATNEVHTISAAAAARKLGLGKAKTLALIHDGRLPAKQLDGRIRVRLVDLDAFLASLPDATKADQVQSWAAVGRASTPSAKSQTVSAHPGNLGSLSWAVHRPTVLRISQRHGTHIGPSRNWGQRYDQGGRASRHRNGSDGSNNAIPSSVE